MCKFLRKIFSRKPSIVNRGKNPHKKGSFLYFLEEDRKKLGLNVPILKKDYYLGSVALQRVKELNKLRNTDNHAGFKKFRKELTNNRGFLSVSEILIRGTEPTEEEIYQQFKNSYSHNKIMRRPKWTHIGMAWCYLVERPNRPPVGYCVVIFGNK